MYKTMFRKYEFKNSVVKTIFSHIIIWAIYLSFQFILETALKTKSILDLQRYSVFIGIFYFSFVIKSLFFKKKLNVWSASICVSLVFLTYWLFEIEKIYNSFNFNKIYYSEDFWPNMIDMINDFLGYGFLGLIYANLTNLERLNNDKLKKEIEKRQIEVDYLKNQINQHFLYNTLNMLYIKSFTYSETLSEKIIVLADSLRNHLNKTKNE
jgi:two-component system, LytTR family, sensor kinase